MSNLQASRLGNFQQKRTALQKNIEDSKRTRLKAWKKRMAKLGYTTDATNTAFKNGKEVGTFEGGLKKTSIKKVNQKNNLKVSSNNNKKEVKKKEVKAVKKNVKEVTTEKPKYKQVTQAELNAKIAEGKKSTEKPKVTEKKQPKLIRKAKGTGFVSTKSARGKQLLKIEDRKRKLREKRFGKKN